MDSDDEPIVISSQRSGKQKRGTAGTPHNAESTQDVEDPCAIVAVIPDEWGYTRDAFTIGCFVAVQSDFGDGSKGVAITQVLTCS